MKWVIVVIMTSVSPDGYDAIQIDNKYDQPLLFETKEACMDHVKENYIPITLFAHKTFDGESGVQDIHCVPQLVEL